MQATVSLLPSDFDDVGCTMEVNFEVPLQVPLLVVVTRAPFRAA